MSEHESQQSPDVEISPVPFSRRISERTKNRVRSVDVNQGRCLVENCAEEKAVVFARCLEKPTKENADIADSLEWSWDLERETLNIDTPYNIFRLTASLHQLFKNGSWFLLPESNIVDTYYNAAYGSEYTKFADWRTFPHIPKGQFQYQFVPIPGRMDRMTIMRQQTTPNQTAAGFKIHYYPFSTLPALTTHLHPQFVICDTGRKVLEFGRQQSQAADQLIEAYPLLTRIVRVYEAWTRPIPDEDSDIDLPCDPPEDEGNENNPDSNMDPPSDCGLGQGSGSSQDEGSSRKRKHRTHLSLSEVALRAHDGPLETKKLRHSSKASVSD